MSPSTRVRLRSGPVASSFVVSPRIQSMRACAHAAPVPSAPPQLPVASRPCCVASRSVSSLNATPPLPGL